MHDRWVSVEEIARYLGVKRDTVYRWIDRRGLPAHRLGRLWKFRLREVDAWVERIGAVVPPKGPKPMALDPEESEVQTARLVEDPTLAEIVRRLVEAYGPERVYLFGSRARSESSRDSDYDLLLVVPDDAPPERRRSRLAYEVLWGTGAAADVLVWTRTRFDARRSVPSSLPATVSREGVILHAA